MAPTASLNDIGAVKASRMIKYEWKIEKFSSHNERQVGDKLKSPVFADQRWYGLIYPKGEKEAENGLISIFLCNNRGVDVKASYTFYLIDGDGNKIRLFDSDFETDVFKKKGCIEHSWGYLTDMKLSDCIDPAKGLVIDDTLTLLFEICTDEDDYVVPDDNCKKCDAFGKLLDSEKFSDVTFIVQSKTIRAHKAILSVKSSVFEAMFAYDMKENQDNVVEIEDTEYDVFLELLRFVYTGKVNDVKNVALSLVVAADKYLIEDLKAMCEYVLKRMLDIEKVFDYLKVSDACNATALKSKVIEFIINNAKDVVNTSKFIEFNLAYPLLSAEVIQKVINAMQLAK